MLLKMDHILAHVIGDFFIQSDWMAVNKTSNWKAITIHALTYSIPFLLPMLLGWWALSWSALAVIAGTHWVIDRWSLAKYICYAKNWFGPRGSNPPFSETMLGYNKDRPFVITFWLYVITDNTLHLIINALSLKYL
jgi:hypothetical protein